jgi:hypothetical protein
MRTTEITIEQIDRRIESLRKCVTESQAVSDNTSLPAPFRQTHEAKQKDWQFEIMCLTSMRDSKSKQESN